MAKFKVAILFATATASLAVAMRTASAASRGLRATFHALVPGGAKWVVDNLVSGESGSNPAGGAIENK